MKLQENDGTCSMLYEWLTGNQPSLMPSTYTAAVASQKYGTEARKTVDGVTIESTGVARRQATRMPSDTPMVKPRISEMAPSRSVHQIADAMTVETGVGKYEVEMPRFPCASSLR